MTAAASGDVSEHMLNKAHEVVFDQWSCGAPWKKPTRLIICGGIDVQDLGMLDNCRCDASGPCVSSSKHHIQLTGSSPGGIPWTRRAQEYPRRVCDKIAKILSDPLKSHRC